LIRRAGVALCACAAFSSVGAQSARFAKIVGVVADSVSGAPLQGAEILTSGVANSVKTDSLGRFTIDSLAPGTYQVAVYHPLLESLDITLATQPFSVGRDSAGVVNLAVPSIPTLVRRYCAGSLSSQEPSVIAGRVIDPDNSQPISGAKVSLSWQELFISKTTGVVRTPHELHVETSSSGFFKICGLPSDVSGTLQVNRGGVLSPEIPVSINGALLDFQNVYVPEKIEAHGDGVVTGHVLSPEGKTIAGARVEIPMSNASTVTREDGSFRFVGLPSGTQMLIVRSISYTTVSQPIDISPREPVDVTIKFSEKVAVLDTVIVTAQRDYALEKVGFTSRKKGGGGHFFTREDLDRRRPHYISDMLRGLPSVTVVSRPGGTVLVGRRVLGGPPPCTTIWVDGFDWGSVMPGDLDAFVNPDDVIGMEVYQAAEVPSRLRKFERGCLTIVLWTDFRGKSTK